MSPQSTSPNSHLILAIDPGTAQSAVVLYDRTRKAPAQMWLEENAECLTIIRGIAQAQKPLPVIEMVASYGMAVGREVFETCVWIGRFLETMQTGDPKRMFRRDVKLCLCANSRAKDANIRQALVDRYGGSDKAAKGTKAAPGPLYGIRKDLWAALAVAVTYDEMLSGRYTSKEGVF